MKVCHLTTAHSANDQRIFYKECCSLSSHGYEVSLIAPNAETKSYLGVNVIGIPLNTHNRLVRFFYNARQIYKKAKRINADIYHFHDPDFLPYAVKLHKSGKKVIYDVHEDYPLNILGKQWIPFFLRKMVSKLYTVIENKSLKYIDAVVTVTPQIVKRYTQRVSTVVMVTNYPILYKNTVIHKVEKSNRFCFAGTIEHLRRIDNIIDAISDIDIRFDLAGSISSKFYDVLTKSKGWSKVTFYGEISYKQVLDLYNKALFGIILEGYHPINYGREGSLGVTKLFEFMRAGLPIICGDHSIHKKIIEKYKCGICINPDSKKALIDAINFMINNKNRAREMGLNGHRAYLEHFNWSTQEIKLIELYKKIENAHI